MSGKHSDVLCIPTTLVHVLFGAAIPTSLFNQKLFLIHLLPLPFFNAMCIVESTDSMIYHFLMILMESSQNFYNSRLAIDIAQKIY